MFDKSNREDLAIHFRSLAHDFFHMKRLPHEFVAGYISYNGKTEKAKDLAEYWAEYLETLAQLVREQVE